VNKGSHPDLVILAGFLQTPDAEEFDSVRVHLADCDMCRSKLEGLEDLCKVIKSDSVISAAPIDDDHLSSEQVSRYTASDLRPGEADTIRAHLEHCGECKKAVLHHRTLKLLANKSNLLADASQVETISLDKELSITKREDDSDAKSAGEKFWKMAFAVAATVAFVAVLLPVVTNYVNHSNDLKVVTYQDTPGLRLVRHQSGTMPNIGFFTSHINDVNPSLPYKGVTVTVSNGLHLSWPPINNVDEYLITMFLYEQNERIKILDSKTKETVLRINDHLLLHNRRYEWELIGFSKQGAFKATGGVVVSSDE